ncbi:GDSL esterase/lipase [Actinidia chinensis var. chinensis]|uniref:GDSL esterase/lipase n=1 Tax=Actinidia chinensis var. chinensis TaxID=1590841 RepID=A0A2R6P3D9_ACTCC|nr:GDSL esterase/lipase [Actinidia chinensis var. chinensis]
MNPNHLFFPLALLSLFLFLSPNKASSLHKSHKGCFSKIYAFGDSYTDTGNPQVLARHTVFAKSNEPVNRLCDGSRVIDFVCEALSLPPLPPYKSTSSNFSLGVNFAIARSTALPMDYEDDIGVSHPLMRKEASLNLQTQVEWFEKFLQEVDCKGRNVSACKAELGNVLFWIGAMGVNDYARAISSSVPLHGLTEMSIGSICKFIQTLLKSGAKYIVVQGLPPVGCLPLAMSSSPLHDRDKIGCAATANSAIMIHNEILQRKLANLKTKYPSSTILYADYWNAYLAILMNPKKYHFEEPFKACCGAGGGELNFNSDSLCGSKGTSTCNDPSKYINWDGIHLTEAMHQHVADLFLNQGFCRPSFDRMIENKSGM